MARASSRNVDPACVSATLRRVRSKRDRKSTRLNSSHQIISYAVFCLKKKKKKKPDLRLLTQQWRETIRADHDGCEGGVAMQSERPYSSRRKRMLNGCGCAMADVNDLQ